MYEVETHDAGAVPCFVVRDDGPLTVGLEFRVGAADETLATHGITHLVEHLALHGVVTAHHPIQGAVDQTHCSFSARGTDEEISAFLRHVTDAVACLPADRLETECGVLRVESANRPPSAYGALVYRLFGAEGYGLAGADELGLWSLEAPAVQRWSDTWFQAGNAALWFVGDPAVVPTIELAGGQRRPPAPPRARTLDLPGWFRDRPGVVAFGVVARPTDAFAVTAQCFERRCFERLRLAGGATYHTSSEMEWWTDEAAFIIASASATPETATAVADGMLDLLDELAADGPTPDELARQTVIRDRLLHEHDSARLWIAR